MKEYSMIRISKLFSALLAASFLISCQELKSTTAKQPLRPVSVAKSTATSSGGEVGASVPVTVRLADKNGGAISKVTPTITLSNSSGAVLSGTTSSGCTVTDIKGFSTCYVTAPSAGTHFLKVLSPIAFVGSAVTFTQSSYTVRFSTQPVGNTAGVAFGTAPVVEILDRAGNRYSTNSSVTIKVTTGQTLTGVLAVSAVAGLATFPALSMTTAGTFTLTAYLTANTAATAVSSSFTITPTAINKIGFTTQPSTTAVASTAFAQQPVVAMQDTYGNTVSSGTCTITFTLVNGGMNDSLLGTLSKPTNTQVANFSGANLRIQSGLGGSTYLLRATASACTIAPATPIVDSDPITVTTAGVPKILELYVSPSSSALNEVWLTQPVVRVLDEDGNLVTSDNNTIVSISSAPVIPGKLGVLTGSQNITVVGGVATFSNLSINSTLPADAGSYRLSFNAVSSNYPDVAFTQIQYDLPISSNGMTPAALLFRIQPANGTKDVTMSAVEVKVVDANGYLCNQATNLITLSLGCCSGALTSSSLAKNAAGGIARWTDLKLTASGVHQLNAAAAGLTSADSNLVSMADYGVASSLTFTESPAGGGATNGLAWATQPIVSVTDNAGNVVSSDNTTVVTLTCVNPGAGCTLAGNVSRQVVGGVATFSGLRTIETGLTNVVIKATSSPVYVEAQSSSFTSNVP